MSCDCGGLNQILPLNVPGTDQSDGTILDVSGLVGEKTIEISGDYSGSYAILASNDGQTFCPVLSFDAGSGSQAFKQTTPPFIVKFLKVRRTAQNLSPVSMSVGAQAACNCAGSGATGANQFVALAIIPAGANTGALGITDLWTVVPANGLDNGWCATCSGDFIGTISLEGSLDGVKFSPLGIIPQTKPGPMASQGSILGFTISPTGNPNSPAPVLAPLIASESVRYVRPRIMPGTLVRGPVTITIGGKQNCDCEGTGGGTISKLTSNDGSVTITNPTGPTSDLSVPAQFGPDTIVKLPNALTNLVNALELVLSLTNNTAGAEASQWLIKLLSAGAQVTAQTILPGQTLFPNGVQAKPGVAFAGDAGMGWYRQDALTLTSCIGGGAVFQITGTGVHTTSNMPYFVNTTSTEGMGFNGTTAFWLFSTTPRDIALGGNGALATNAATGFVDLPSCAGAPTGAPTQVPTGKSAIVIDTTNSKIWINFGGTWKATAALT